MDMCLPSSRTVLARLRDCSQRRSDLALSCVVQMSAVNKYLLLYLMRSICIQTGQKRVIRPRDTHQRGDGLRVTKRNTTRITCAIYSGNLADVRCSAAVTVRTLFLGELVALLRERARRTESGREAVLDGRAADPIAFADFAARTHLHTSTVNPIVSAHKAERQRTSKIHPAQQK